MMPSVPDRDSRQAPQLMIHPQPSTQRTQRSQAWLSRSKNLDLALLAGCSCLLTVLYHPVANAFASHSATTASNGSVASTAGLVTSQPQQSNSLQLTMPQRKLNAKRDLQSDED